METLEAMSDGFFTLDRQGRFTYLNPQSEALLERRSEDLIGEFVWEAFPETAGSRFGDEYRRALRERVPVRFEESYEPLGRSFEARAYPVAEGLAVYFTDVTDERVRDERVRQAQRLEAIGRVTATVAHDFNNFLTAIGGFASLGRDASQETGSECFAQIASASERAVALTRQLLVFAREQELAPTVVDLDEFVSGLAPMLRQLLPAGIELRLAPAPRPVFVFVDRSQLEQVLLNLVVNSRDAIDGAGTITVSTTIEEPPDVVHDVRVASGWLQVADTGIGIPDDVLPLIFDPFFSTKPPRRGNGPRPRDDLRHRLPERRNHHRRLDPRRRDHDDGRAPRTAPALTLAIASSSRAPRAWSSTTKPASAATAGSSDISTPNTASGSRRSASSSSEYGSTEEASATTSAAASRSGCASAISAWITPAGSTISAPTAIASASPEPPANAAPVRLLR